MAIICTQAFNAVTQTHEKISTLLQLDERIEAIEEETTTNGVL
jgi:hypothetical protein